MRWWLLVLANMSTQSWWTCIFVHRWGSNRCAFQSVISSTHTGTVGDLSCQWNPIKNWFMADVIMQDLLFNFTPQGDACCLSLSRETRLSLSCFKMIWTVSWLHSRQDAMMCERPVWRPHMAGSQWCDKSGCKTPSRKSISQVPEPPLTLGGRASNLLARLQNVSFRYPSLPLRAEKERASPEITPQTVAMRRPSSWGEVSYGGNQVSGAYSSKAHN